MTYDGRYENCQYWQFLERHRDLRPAQRKIFAQAAIDAIDAELDRKRKQRSELASAAAAGQNRQEMKSKERKQERGRSPRKRSSPPLF